MAVFGDEAMERAYTRVEREALSGTQARERPTAILIGGQPGAGKSVLARQATEDLRPLGGSVLIDADRMRENNPAYHRLARENPAAAADLTHAEAGRWSVRLTNAAMDTQRNVVIDGTMRNPENLRLLVSRLKDRGYFVEVRGIAMHSDVSLARAQLRFEREYAVTGAGRAVTASQHDQAYAGMLRTVDLLEREKAVDAVRIYDGRQRPIYSNEQQAGRWLRDPAAAQAISEERERPMSRSEASEYAEMLGYVVELRKTREASPLDMLDATLRHREAMARAEHGVLATMQTTVDVRSGVVRERQEREPTRVQSRDEAQPQTPGRTERSPESVTAPARGESTLRIALESAERESPHLGRFPDPIAQDILASGRVDELESRLHELGIGAVHPIGAGASSIVLAAEDNRVVRLGVGELAARPQVNEILHPLASGTIGSLRYEIMPRADTHSVTDQDAEKMYRTLREQGYEWGEKAVDNIGRVNGRVVVIDPGGIVPIEVLEARDARTVTAIESNAALLDRLRATSRLPDASAALADEGRQQSVGGRDESRERASIDRSKDIARATAFDTLERDQALALFPELDSAYRHLDERTAFSTVPQSEIERADLSARLHRGDIPKAGVTEEESRRAIGLAGDNQNLILRDAADLERNYRGQVVAASTHHTLVRISDMVGVVYPRARLSRDLRSGEDVSIQYSHDPNAPHAVHEKDHPVAAERSHSVERGIER